MPIRSPVARPPAARQSVMFRITEIVSPMKRNNVGSIFRPEPF
jgi:hypothetical protein